MLFTKRESGEVGSNLITDIFKSRVFSGCWRERKSDTLKTEEYCSAVGFEDRGATGKDR